MQPNYQNMRWFYGGAVLFCLMTNPNPVEGKFKIIHTPILLIPGSSDRPEICGMTDPRVFGCGRVIFIGQLRYPVAGRWRGEYFDPGVRRCRVEIEYNQGGWRGVSKKNYRITLYTFI